MTFNPGDKIEVITKDEVVKGILLPSFHEGIMFVKLDNGYNIGIDKQQVVEVKKIGEGVKLDVFPSVEVKHDESLPDVSIVATGGTIASRLDYETGGVKWLMEPGQIFFLAPEISKICNVRKIEKPFAIASESMSFSKWARIANEVAKLLNAGDKGVIVTHGTDTLHFTGAALSFMLKGLKKPVVLTYAQRSTDRGSTDTAMNLICSAQIAVSGVGGVMLVGHGTTDDEYCLAIGGTKVRKMHTSRRDTFRPINDVAVAKVFKDGKIEMIKKNHVARDDDCKVEVNDKYEDKIALVKYVPGMSADIIDSLVDKKIKGIVLEVTGLGHVGTSESDRNWIPSIKRAIKEGVIVCAAAQCLYGRLDPYVYSNGRELLQMGVIFLKDMLPETAYVKLGCVLGNFSSPRDVKREMLTNYAGEFNDRLDERMFLN